jgi:hypothetical protein
MINARKRKVHGNHLVCPITKKPMHLVGTIFMDDTDLVHLDMNKVETLEEVHMALQESIHNWGCILIATGGALKPAKCFYHLISFSWKQDGTWQYSPNNKRPDLNIMVPTEDGTFAAIEHLLVLSSPTKTLGQMTFPTGNSGGAIAQMNKKAQGWIDKAKSSKLHKRNLWFLLDKQFWPRVAFGISSITAPFDVLEKCLMRKYFDLLLISGICRLVSREIRQMDRGFYGISFPHPGVERMVTQINKLLTHYVSSS